MNLQLKSLDTLINKQESLKQTMLDFTVEAANINSGSFNYEGANTLLSFYKQKFIQEFSSINIAIEEIDVAPLNVINSAGKTESLPVGRALRVIKKSEQNNPVDAEAKLISNNNNAAKSNVENSDAINSSNKKVKVLLVGHLDTVFAKDHSFQKVKFIDDNTINGPGVADMKGGITVMIYALKLLEQTEYGKLIDWEVLLTPDEEIGSWGSAPLLKESAQRNDVGIVFEPSLDDKGTFAGQRKGSGDFTIIAKGLAAHAGRSFYDGKNAIVASAKLIDAIYELNGTREHVTINIGKIVGGEAINIVPDTCVIKIGVRYPKAEDEAWIRSNIEQLTKEISSKTNVEFEVIGAFSRKPKHIINDTKKLYELVQQVGKEISIPVTWQPSGGCCDGNNLFEYGLPNIDTMGVRGAKIHSDKEYMYIDSFIERLKLTLGTLITLSDSWHNS